MRRSAALGLALLAGCATVAADRPITGRWGGQHVGLELRADGATLDYDCAAGTIDGPVLPDAAGRFAASGTHTPGIGGPVQVGVTPRSWAARYWGSVRGDTMTLSVKVENGILIGPYSLRRGAEPLLMRCL